MDVSTAVTVHIYKKEIKRKTNGVQRKKPKRILKHGYSKGER